MLTPSERDQLHEALRDCGLEELTPRLNAALDSEVVAWVITIDGVPLYFPVEELGSEALDSWKRSGINPKPLCIKYL